MIKFTKFAGSWIVGASELLEYLDYTSITTIVKISLYVFRKIPSVYGRNSEAH